MLMSYALFIQIHFCDLMQWLFLLHSTKDVKYLCTLNSMALQMKAQVC